MCAGMRGGDARGHIACASNASLTPCSPALPRAAPGPWSPRWPFCSPEPPRAPPPARARASGRVGHRSTPPRPPPPPFRPDLLVRVQTLQRPAAAAALDVAEQAPNLRVGGLGGRGEAFGSKRLWRVNERRARAPPPPASPPTSTHLFVEHASQRRLLGRARLGGALGHHHHLGAAGWACGSVRTCGAAPLTCPPPRLPLGPPRPSPAAQRSPPALTAP